jgi:single-strand DNA-binding protein
VGADPEIRTTPGGGRVAQFSLATSRRWTGQNGDQQEKTEWHRVVAWDSARGAKLANVCEQYVKKGDKLYVEGQIEYRTWDDKDGQKRYTTEIVGREVILLGGKDEERQLAAAAAPKGAAADFDKRPEVLDEEDDLPF